MALRRDESIGDGVRRLVGGRLAVAARLLADPDGVTEEAVHDVRTSCTEARALLRLVSPAVGDRFPPADRSLRRAARVLGPLRDAQVLQGAFDRLDLPAGDGWERVRDQLDDRVARATVVASAERRQQAGRRVADVAEDVAGWRIQGDADLVAEGIRRAHRRARRAMAAGDGDEQLHAWRTRTKVLRHQVRWLVPAAPTLLQPWADGLHDLTDRLGDDHDLAVLVATMRQEPGAFGGDAVVGLVAEAAAPVRADLRAAARAEGARLLAERPKAAGRRVAAHLEAWWASGDQPRSP